MTGKIMRPIDARTVEVKLSTGVLVRCTVSRRLGQCVHIGSTVIIDVSPYNDRQGRIVSEVKDDVRS